MAIKTIGQAFIDNPRTVWDGTETIPIDDGSTNPAAGLASSLATYAASLVSVPTVPTITAFAETFLDDANAAGVRATLGLGSLATASSITASSVSDFSEAVDDRVASLLVAGSNVTLTYNDVANTLTVASTASIADGDHGDLSSASGVFTIDSDVISAFGRTLTDDADAATARSTLGLGSLATASSITASSVSDFSEAVDDRVGALLVAGSNVTLTYNDGANTLTVASTASVSDGDKGDITVSGSGSTFTIDSNVISTFGRTLTDDADATTARTTLGLGALATASSITASSVSDFSEAVDDRVGTLLVAGTDIGITYNDGANTLTIASTATGGSVGRHMVPVSAGSMAPSVTGGSATLASLASAANQPDIVSLDFDSTTQEYAQFSVPMPKSWNEGTVTFSAIWSHAATTTNFGVVWSLQALAVSDNEAIAQAFGTVQTSTDTGGTTNNVYVSPESSAITIAGTPAAEDVVFFRVSRVTADASDTMAIDARLQGIKLYITTDAGTDT
jgi:uncharacterized protein YqkB